MRQAIAITKGDRLKIRLPSDDPAVGEVTIEFVALAKAAGGFRLQPMSGDPVRFFSYFVMFRHVIEGRVDKILDFTTERLTLLRPMALAWETLSTQQRDRAQRRAHTCREVRRTFSCDDPSNAKLERFLAVHRDDPAFPEMLSSPTLRRWLNIFRPGDPPVVLADESRPGGPRSLPEVTDIVDQAIDRHYLCERPATRRELHREVVSKIKARNRQRLDSDPNAELLIAPSYPTICRAVQQLDAFEVEHHQNCLRAAKSKFKISDTVEWSFHAGALVSIDATQIDVHLTAGDNLAFRPWWTVVQCVRTGIILGWCFSLKRPDVAVIIAAFRHAVSRKPAMAERFGDFISNEFEFYGAPQGVLLDNALEHLSQEVSDCLQAIGFTNVEFTETYDPTKRGQIERFFRSANTALFHRLPRAVRRKRRDHTSNRQDEQAVVTFPALDKLIHKFVVDIHPFRYVKRLKKRRIDVWREDRKRIPADEFIDPSTIHALAAGDVHRSLSGQGVQFMGGRYGTNAELGNLRIADKAQGSQFQIHWNPLDLGAILVADGNGGVIQATARDRSRVGASLLDVEVELLRENIKKEQDRRQREKAEEDLDQEINAASRKRQSVSKKVRKRRRGSPQRRLKKQSPIVGAALGQARPSSSIHDVGQRIATQHFVETPDPAAIAAVRARAYRGVVPR